MGASIDEVVDIIAATVPPKENFSKSACLNFRFFLFLYFYHTVINLERKRKFSAYIQKVLWKNQIKKLGAEKYIIFLNQAHKFKTFIKLNR